MSRYVRIIPRLDIKGPNLVKGIHLEGLRVLGDPAVFAQCYYENGACELFYVDVVASLLERNSLDQIISRIAQKTFIPITVAGGIRNLDDIKRILDSGADKVSLNTAAVKNPKIIYDASLKFGSSTIVVTVEAIKKEDGKYYAYIDNGREFTGLEIFEWVKKVESLGAGEIVITSVDREGTGSGFDIDLVGQVANSVNVPVVAHGGAGCIQDVIDLIEKTNVNGVSIASSLHYHFLAQNEYKKNHSVNEGNTIFLERQAQQKKVTSFSLRDLISEVKKHNFVCR